MTEEQIKEMLNGIINNGEEWECRPKGYYCSEERKYVDEQCDYDACAHTCRDDCYCNWEPYKLGDEIHSDWDYRKVENWSVIEWNDTHTLEVRTLRDAENTIGAFIQITFKTKEECEKWIEEHTKKTWLEEYLENYFTEHTEYSLSRKGDLLGGIRIGATEVCKKILEEANKIGCKDTVSFIKEIIKDLGVEL